jgi:hypothetical protein
MINYQIYPKVISKYVFNKTGSLEKFPDFIFEDKSN